MQKIVTVIQARMGSSRFPGKVMLPLAGKSLIVQMVERIKSSKYLGKIVVGVTHGEIDDPLVEELERNNIIYFRGHPTDLLDRHLNVAKRHKADTVVKIPSDCPLIDPSVIDKVIKFYIDNFPYYDYVSNLHPATYPDGNDVEIFSIDCLEKAWEEAKRDFEREHTTPYFWENHDKFKIGNVEWETGLDYSMSYRFTIDYEEDYLFIKAIYDELYDNNPHFTLADILKLLQQKPELLKINEKFAGVNWYRHHLNELTTVFKKDTKILRDEERKKTSA